jgi:hypothetical protein
MAKQKLSPVVLLPNGLTGAYFAPNCFYCLQAINPETPKHDVKEPQDPVPWPGQPLGYLANLTAGALRMS